MFLSPMKQPRVYLWYAPTVLLPKITSMMSKRLGLHHDLVRAALGHEVQRVIGDVNAYCKVYPPISKEHQFTAEVTNKQWLKGTGLYEPFSDFIESLRDDLDLLRHNVADCLGLYSTPEYIQHCCKTGVFSFPIIGESDIQDHTLWRGENHVCVPSMVKEGRVFSQGSAMILPEFGGDYLLPRWVDEELIYVHRLPRELVAYTTVV